MKCAIHQPQFLPWLGYLHKVSRVERFIFLDNVQFKKNEFQNRNKLLVAGVARWVTVPVRFSFGDTLRQTRIVEQEPWRRKMWNTIELNYSRAPFFKSFGPSLKDLILGDNSDNLAAFNEATVRWLLACFEIRTELFSASRFDGLSDDPTGRLIDLCQRVGADTYFSGAGGRGYLVESEFEKNGISLEYQHFVHPEYPQFNKPKDSAFVPFLSTLDGLFNCGGGAAGRKALALD